MQEGLVRAWRRTPPLRHTARALYTFGLRSDCSQSEARLAFVRLYVPAARAAVLGGRVATNRCRMLIRRYKIVMRWIRKHQPPGGIVGVEGAGHEFFWRW